jgi:hypothetical protein
MHLKVSCFLSLSRVLISLEDLLDWAHQTRQLTFLMLQDLEDLVDKSNLESFYIRNLCIWIQSLSTEINKKFTLATVCQPGQCGFLRTTCP